MCDNFEIENNITSFLQCVQKVRELFLYQVCLIKKNNKKAISRKFFVITGASKIMAAFLKSNISLSFYDKCFIFSVNSHFDVLIKKNISKNFNSKSIFFYLIHLKVPQTLELSQYFFLRNTSKSYIFL
jgi:hypothetical protein